jgi:5-methylcytosine-specific restriction endonuclease McrA
LVVAALECARDELNRDRFARPTDDIAVEGGATADENELEKVTNADALLRMADRAIAGEPVRTGAERYLAIVELDEATLLGDEAGSVAVTRDGAALPAETARRLCCDASLVRAQKGHVGRRTRTIPAAMRRALARRDDGCQFPGCQARRHVDAHHIQHWAHGGKTTMSNLIQLCRHHHRLVHEGGYAVERDRDGMEFRRPDGGRLRSVPRPRRGDPLRVIRPVGGRPRMDAQTIVPGWCGDRLDLGAAVDALLDMAPPNVPD